MSTLPAELHFGIVPGLVLFIAVIGIGSNTRADLGVEHMATGPYTNCYLLYDPLERNAALIDVAGPIEPLLSTIRSKDLDLRYFLFTHGHFDHILGFPAIRTKFPNAKVCLHRLDYDDLSTQKEWVQSNLDQEILDYIAADPELKKLMEFDAATFGTPDIYVTDKEKLDFGTYEITVLHSPGHSPGSVCYYVGKFLFSGDVLFRDSVGRVDVQNSSWEDQVRSVRRLYDLLPDSTVVYPGHDEFTTIGREKYENTKITVDEIHLSKPE